MILVACFFSSTKSFQIRQLWCSSRLETLFCADANMWLTCLVGRRCQSRRSQPSPSLASGIIWEESTGERDLWRKRFCCKEKYFVSVWCGKIEGMHATVPPVSDARLGEMSTVYFIYSALMPSLAADGISGYGQERSRHHPRHADVPHALTATPTTAWSANSSGTRETARNCRGRRKR